MLTALLLIALVVLLAGVAGAVVSGAWSGTWAGSGMPPDGRYFARRPSSDGSA